MKRQYLWLFLAIFSTSGIFWTDFRLDPKQMDRKQINSWIDRKRTKLQPKIWEMGGVAAHLPESTG